MKANRTSPSQAGRDFQGPSGPPVTDKRLKSHNLDTDPQKVSHLPPW